MKSIRHSLNQSMGPTSLYVRTRLLTNPTQDHYATSQIKMPYYTAEHQLSMMGERTSESERSFSSSATEVRSFIATQRTVTQRIGRMENRYSFIKNSSENQRRINSFSQYIFETLPHLRPVCLYYTFFLSGSGE